MDMTQDPYWQFLNKQLKALKEELGRSNSRHFTQRRQELRVQIEALKRAKQSVERQGPSHVDYGLF